jgi:hypothetical protein
MLAPVERLSAPRLLCRRADSAADSHHAANPHGSALNGGESLDDDRAAAGSEVGVDARCERVKAFAAGRG